MDFESWVTGDRIRQFSDLCNCCHTQLCNFSHQLSSGGILPITSSVFSLSCVVKLWSRAPEWPAELAYVSTVKQLPVFDQWNCNLVLAPLLRSGSQVLQQPPITSTFLNIWWLLCVLPCQLWFWHKCTRSLIHLTGSNLAERKEAEGHSRMQSDL